MDPVIIIATALSAGTLAGLSKVTENAVLDGYEALKNIIKNKYGQNSDLVNAINQLEEKPESKGRQLIVEEEIEASGVKTDENIISLSRELMVLLAAKEANSINITGNDNIVGNKNVVRKTTQKAKDNSIQINDARDVNIGK